MLPVFLTAGDIANGTLVQVLADWPVASRDIYAIFPGTMAPKAKVRLFIEYLQAHVAKPSITVEEPAHTSI